MTIVQLAGLVIFFLVTGALGVDIVDHIQANEKHPIITPTHAVMLMIALFAVVMTHKEMSKRFVAFVLALRGVKGRTAETPVPPTRAPRRKKIHQPPRS